MSSTRTFGLTIAALATLMAAPSANAALSIVSSVGGAPTGVNRSNLDGLALGTGSPQAIAPGVTLTLSGDAAIVQGALSGRYAAPFLSGGNGQGFGSPNQADGPDATRYLTSGSTGSFSNAAAAITFSTPQAYFGLLWGSVDTYNILTFFNGAIQVGQLTGSAVTPTATGNQGMNGTFYVNINSDLAFNRVVVSSSQYAFELDNIAWSAAPVNVAEPASLALLGAGLLGLGVLRRRRRG